MRVAIVHEWLDVWGGSEQVLAAMLRLWPGADVFCLTDRLPAEDRARLAGHRVIASALDRVPLAARGVRLLLPLLPRVVESLDLSGYDLVVANSHCVAKGALVGPDQAFVAYVHSPARYAWDLRGDYLDPLPAPLRFPASAMLHGFRQWDRASAAGPDRLIANSAFVARRIRRVWGRAAQVVHPPVDLQAIQPRDDKEDFYLLAGRLVAYKNPAAVVEAFAAMPGRRLLVAGDGPERRRIGKSAGPSVRFAGRVTRPEMIDLLRRARALVFAAEEDFGLLPVEAQAAGTPVIALGRGGATETVVEGVTGLFFDAPTPAAIRAAVARFETAAFHPADCRANAERFSESQFQDGLAREVAAVLHPPRQDYTTGTQCQDYTTGTQCQAVPS